MQNDNFNNFIQCRTNQITIAIVKKNPEYIRCTKLRHDLYSELLKHLPDKSKYLIYQFKEIETDLQAISNKFNYTQGLKDGIELLLEEQR
jgi:hypothetical protein